MPDVAVLVAICASRVGETAYAYASTRTEMAFSLDVMAWVSSWAAPATAMLGKGKGGEARGVSSAIPDKYRGIKPSNADSVNFVDLDKLDRPKTAGQIPAMMGLAFPVASNAMIQAWEDKVRSKAVKIDATRGETVRSVRQAAKSGPGGGETARPRGGQDQS